MAGAAGQRRVAVPTRILDGRDGAPDGSAWLAQAFGESRRDAGATVLATAAGDCIAGLFIGGSAAFGLALIPQLFALGECEFYFHPAILEIHAGWDQGQPFLLSAPDQLPDFIFVHKQFAGAQRGVIEDVAVVVGSDMGIQQPQLAILDQPVGVFEIGGSRANRLDLGTGQGDAGLKFFQQEIVVGSDPINSGVSLSGSSRIPARVLLRVRLGLVCGLAGHT